MGKQDFDAHWSMVVERRGCLSLLAWQAWWCQRRLGSRKLSSDSRSRPARKESPDQASLPLNECRPPNQSQSTAVMAPRTLRETGPDQIIHCRISPHHMQIDSRYRRMYLAVSTAFFRARKCWHYPQSRRLADRNLPPVGFPFLMMRPLH